MPAPEGIHHVKAGTFPWSTVAVIVSDPPGEIADESAVSVSVVGVGSCACAFKLGSKKNAAIKSTAASSFLQVFDIS